MTGTKRTRRSKPKGRKPAQAGLPFHRNGRWGGARPGAGRPALPEHRRKGVAHRPRRRLAASRPVHITVRLRPALAGLRSQRAHRQILRCFLAGKERFGFRLLGWPAGLACRPSRPIVGFCSRRS